MVGKPVLIDVTVVGPHRFTSAELFIILKHEIG
jgi:hypothetical protein